MLRKILFIAFMGLVLFASCKKTKTLAEYRREERESIEKYIKDNDIKVLTEMPPDSVFADDQYYLDKATGLYIQINNKGFGEKPQKGELVSFRYYMFGMSNDTLAKAMTSEESRDATEFKYGSGIYNVVDNYDYSQYTVLNGSYVITGIQEAIGYLKFGGAAHLIVPSSIGSATAQSSVKAYCYEIGNVKIR